MKVMTKAERIARRAARLPQVASGTTAQFLLMDVSKASPKQEPLVPISGVLDERWANFHKEVLARPVESRILIDAK